jgi:hypothetical protein
MHKWTRRAVEPERGERSRLMNQPHEQTIIDNEVYDLIMATASKLEGLAAYNKYEQDGETNAQIWQQLRQQDEQATRQLLQQLTQLAQQGRLTTT